MRALFSSALLAVGAMSANTKTHGPWTIETNLAGPGLRVTQGTIGFNTDWSKTGG